MSVSYNRVIIAGNIVRDPELKTLTNSGQAAAKFTLAVNRKYTRKDGTLKEDTTWVPCVAFAKVAERIAKYARKGAGLLVDGELRQDQWDDKDSGERRSKTYVLVVASQFLSRPAERTDDGGDDVAARQREAVVRDEFSEEEIPF